jgi:hypothetical protein
VGELRNEFAHQLNRKLDDKDAQKLLAAFNEVPLQHAKRVYEKLRADKHNDWPAELAEIPPRT